MLLQQLQARFLQISLVRLENWENKQRDGSEIESAQSRNFLRYLKGLFGSGGGGRLVCDETTLLGK